MSTPILNPPQSAILGMHKIQDRPMAIGGKIEIRPMMYLAVSYDHRIVDGKEAVSFLVRVKEGVEDPRRLLLGSVGAAIWTVGDHERAASTSSSSAPARAAMSAPSAPRSSA